MITTHGQLALAGRVLSWAEVGGGVSGFHGAESSQDINRGGREGRVGS